MHLYNFIDTFVNIISLWLLILAKIRLSYFLTMAKKKKISTIVVKEAANKSNPEEGIRKG